MRVSKASFISYFSIFSLFHESWRCSLSWWGERESSLSKNRSRWPLWSHWHSLTQSLPISQEIKLPASSLVLSLRPCGLWTPDPDSWRSRCNDSQIPRCLQWALVERVTETEDWADSQRGELSLHHQPWRETPCWFGIPKETDWYSQRSANESDSLLKGGKESKKTATHHFCNCLLRWQLHDCEKHWVSNWAR